jgi:ABC-type multidrug transport system fused ATPase/permease subunit
MTIRAVLTFSSDHDFRDHHELCDLVALGHDLRGHLVPVVLVGSHYLGDGRPSLFVAVFRKYDELNQEVQEDLAGIRVVKAYGRQRRGKEEIRRI